MVALFKVLIIGGEFIFVIGAGWAGMEEFLPLPGEERHKSTKMPISIWVGLIGGGLFLIGQLVGIWVPSDIKAEFPSGGLF